MTELKINMSAAEILSLISTGLVVVGEAVRIGKALRTEIEAFIADLVELIQAFINGEEISDDKIADLRARIVALSEENAKLEESIT